MDNLKVLGNEKCLPLKFYSIKSDTMCKIIAWSKHLIKAIAAGNNNNNNKNRIDQQFDEIESPIFGIDWILHAN